MLVLSSHQGTAVAQWLRYCATNRKVAVSIPADVSGFFIDIKSFWLHYPGVFPGGKGGRCVRLTILPPSCAAVTKSGSLNFLEPSGPVQACNWTALPLLSSHRYCYGAVQSSNLETVQDNTLSWLARMKCSERQQPTRPHNIAPK